MRPLQTDDESEQLVWQANSSCRSAQGVNFTMPNMEQLPRPIDDFGGLAADPLTILERELLPREKRCHATLEC